MTSKLFQPFNLLGLEFPNRIVMAPLTRNRADLENDAPTPLHCEYYAQRATAGRIISKDAQIFAEGKGYFRTPGLYSRAQQKAWRRVTDAVHSADGRMFAQLWHVGRIAHTSLQPDGQRPVAPSAIAADAKTFTADGFAQCSEPRALRTEAMPRLVEDFVDSARSTKDAGFDGVELHVANGYLLDQFFREASNTRDDDHGGSVENRTRLLGNIPSFGAAVGITGRLNPTGVWLS
jgi:N-ethylmaleimide reductase